MDSHIYQFKREQMISLSQYRDKLRETPDLKWLFFELTNRCNLLCSHCGSRCRNEGRDLPLESVIGTISTLPSKHTMICLTGGEPLLHPQFFDIAHAIHDYGFCWGITTNGTLINEATAKALYDAHLGTVSISIDGLESTHDKLRKVRGSWKRAINGIRCLQDQGINPQVTTVIYPGNIDELEALFSLLTQTSHMNNVGRTLKTL